MSEPALSPALARTVAIVPTYNVGSRVVGVVQGLAHVGCRAIVVDDGSTDHGSREFGNSDVDLIQISRNRGKGHAILTGIEKAIENPETERIAVLDADGQHDPAELPRLLDAFDRTQADLLIGAREFDSGRVPFRSRFGNVLTVYALRLLLGTQLPDTQSGYRIMSRRFAEAVLRQVPGGRYETEMAIVGLAIQGGYTITSEPIRTIYEPGNQTSHFRKIEDSIRVYYALLKAAFKSRKK